MKIRLLQFLILTVSLAVSCKQKTADNLEEMARRASHPEAVLVKTAELEKSTFYHELVVQWQGVFIRKGRCSI